MIDYSSSNFAIPVVLLFDLFILARNAQLQDG